MKVDLPPVGSKKWPWVKESTADEDLILVLETPVGYYTIEVEASTARVTLDTSDDDDLLEVFSYDLMRLGSRTDMGTTLDRAQERRAIARVKRLVECEARYATRCRQEACNQKKSTSQPTSNPTAPSPAPTPCSPSEASPSTKPVES